MQIEKQKKMRRSRAPITSKMMLDFAGVAIGISGVVMGVRTSDLNILTLSLSFAFFWPMFTEVCFHIFYPWRTSEYDMYEEGDPVVYFQHKHSTHPTSRACNLSAAECGDDYEYDVEKAWVVLSVDRIKSSVTCVTPSGKRRTVALNDNRLHRATPWERIRYGNRYRQAADALLTGAVPMAEVPQVTDKQA